MILYLLSNRLMCLPDLPKQIPWHVLFEYPGYQKWICPTTQQTNKQFGLFASGGLKYVNQLWHTDNIKIIPLTVIITKPVSSRDLDKQSSRPFLLYPDLIMDLKPVTWFHSNTIRGQKRNKNILFTLRQTLLCIPLTEQNQKCLH